MGLRRFPITCSITIALVLAGCHGNVDSKPISKASVSAKKQTTLRDGDVTLTIPRGAVSSDGTLTLSASKDEPPNDTMTQDLVERTPLIRVQLKDAELTGRATVSRVVPASWKSELVPIMVWQDSDGGWQWLPTTVKSQDGKRVAQARTGHFSNGFLAGFDVNAAAARTSERIKNLFTGRAGVASPRCQDEPGARKSLKVTSDAGDAVKWCVGLEGGDLVLKVANNRRSFAQVSIPKSAKVISGAGYGFSINNLVRTLGEGLTRFSEAFPDDRETLLLESGKSVTIKVSKTADGGAQVTGSGIGFLLQILVNAVDMFSTVSKAAGIKAATNSDAIFNLLGTGAGKKSDWAEATFHCLRTFTDVYLDDPAAPVSAVAEIERAFKFAGTCGSEIGAASVEASGLLGWMATATAATVASLVSTVFGLIEQLFAGLREIVDSAAYLFGSKTDPTYDVLTEPLVGSALLGTSWFVHGGGLDIRRDGTATSSGHGICPDADSEGWCSDITELAVQPLPGGLKLVVTKTYVRKEGTKEIFPASEFAAPVGSYWIVRPYGEDHLISEFWEGSQRYDMEGGNGLGNPYLCKDGTSNAQGLCGA